MEPSPIPGAEEPVPAFTRIAPYYDELMHDVPYRAWVRFVLTLCRRHGLDPGRCLELACGTATIALMLADQSVEVAGLDRSSAMIDVARKKCAAAGAEIPLAVADLRSFGRETVGASEPFDLALCLYDSLNNILEPSGVRESFRCVESVLRPGGLFIFDVNTEYAFRANLFSQTNMNPSAPIQYRWVSSYDYSARVCTVNMQFWVQQKGVRQHFTEIHQQRAYSETELDRMLSEAGLELVGVYDGLTLRPPNRHTDRMYCVARTQSCRLDCKAVDSVAKP